MELSPVTPPSGPPDTPHVGTGLPPPTYPQACGLVLCGAFLWTAGNFFKCVRWIASEQPDVAVSPYHIISDDLLVDSGSDLFQKGAKKLAPPVGAAVVITVIAKLALSNLKSPV